MAIERVPLWGGMKIPIIVLSGEVNSGKSLFPLFIDPACRTPDAAPSTIIFDQEGSAETYEGSLNFKWFDSRRAVFEGVHRGVVAAGANDPKWLQVLKTKADVNDSPSASMFRAAYLSLLSIESGKYRVMGFDTFTPIQDGMVDWLRKHPEAFGRTANQYEKASSMFLWPDVKAMLGHILAVDCRLRFETVCLCVHLKAKWEGDRKTKERIAEGLDVLDKLATLHIRLDRSPDDKGNVPKEPIGTLMKERLIRFGATPDEDSPILPPRIEKCTPDTIRAWIAKPADYAKLKKAEKVVVKEPSEIELQEMKLHTAEAEAEAAAAKSALLQQQSTRQKELAEIRRMAQSPAEKAEAEKLATEVPAAMEAAHEKGKEIAAKAEGEHAEANKVQEATQAAKAANDDAAISPEAERIEHFKALLPACGIDPEKIKAAMAEKGASRFTELSEPHQDGLLAVMLKAFHKLAANKGKAPF